VNTGRLTGKLGAPIVRVRPGNDGDYAVSYWLSSRGRNSATRARASWAVA
jgi:hypothetical protein